MSISALGASPLMPIPGPDRSEATSPPPDRDRDADDVAAKSASARATLAVPAVAPTTDRIVNLTV
jgi:hypothetical protein